MKISVIDNYDSFTYNLVYYLREITGNRVDVFRNDEIVPEELEPYDHIVLSPGPGIPEEAGNTLAVIRRWAEEKNILGICLGHQAIAEVFGGRLVNLDQPHHGIRSQIHVLTRDPLYEGIPRTFSAGRYHSWVVDRDTLPAEITVTSEDDNGLIMGLTHKHYKVRGLQFHPESVMTEHGYQMILNWVKNL
jgi:anthranilate synthase component 2